ncbi:DNA cytosine methyltransferase [Salibacterium lacus]|uniref:DNA (cytosine-5-)-methyltransferase n=1 Tax=Salibacterium lacus TaxID=1898109 RepID=A0ABW5T5Z5_9BACI
MLKPVAIDLFSGCGGLSEGLKQAGFDVRGAVEIDQTASQTYIENHPSTKLVNKDIKEVSGVELIKKIGEDVTLIAGCPPCQGFSTLKTKKKKNSLKDKRNELIFEFIRIVKELLPTFIMVENVPGLKDYLHFNEAIQELTYLGYGIDYQIINVADFGVPQRRKRLVLMGSLLNKNIKVPIGDSVKQTTVRDCIYGLEKPEETDDSLHSIHSKHNDRIKKMITLIPGDGGSRKDLPQEYWLECHKKGGVGFSDVYGRLSWDQLSSTITSGCLSPSKGRFLHPEQNRSISAREAALLQTFPIDYRFPVLKNKTSLAQMIGNAFPPGVSKIQGEYFMSLLDKIGSVS